MHVKMCGQCERILNPSEYYKRKASLDGLSNMCRACVRDAKRLSAGRIRDMWERGELEVSPERKCPSCGEVKSAEEYHKSKWNRSGLNTYCKACTREKNREWMRRRKREGLA